MILRFSYWVATVFGAGYLKPAPGTWGTIPGVLIYLFYPSYFFTALLFFVGWWGSYIILNASKEDDKDPSFIVIDEVVGIMLTLLIMNAVGWRDVLVGFVLFRIYDIIKPFPIGWLDQKLSERGNALASFGIMIDDILAGVMAGIAGILMKLWIP